MLVSSHWEPLPSIWLERRLRSFLVVMMASAGVCCVSWQLVLSLWCNLEQNGAHDTIRRCESSSYSPLAFLNIFLVTFCTSLSQHNFPVTVKVSTSEWIVV
eukprot:2669359-Amphidinium_carterae.1